MIGPKSGCDELQILALAADSTALSSISGTWYKQVAKHG